jgi:HlyD family secretion protein
MPLLAQDARLTAESARAHEIAFPADLLASAHARALDAMVGQRALFEARKGSLDSQLKVLAARIEQQEATSSGARGQLIATRRPLELIRQEEKVRCAAAS